MKKNTSNFRVYSPSLFINTDSSSSSHQRLPDLDSDIQISVFNTEIPNYSKYSLEHKSTEKLYLNNSKRQTVHDRRAYSGHFCPNCISYQKTVEDLKQRESSLSEKLIVTEKHLKQYDNLLQIKDTRLKQQEASLKTELESFDKEKEKLTWEKRRVEEERLEIRKERQYLSVENERLEQEMEELARKAEEVQGMIEELDEKKMEILEIERRSACRELDDRKFMIISRENDIQRLMEEVQGYRTESSPLGNEGPENFHKYLKQKEKNKILKSKLGELAEEICELKERFEAEQKQNIEEFESRMMILTDTEEKLIEEKKRLELLSFETNEKMETIEQLKSALIMQQENLEKEKSLWQSRLLENSLDTPKRSKTRFTIKKEETSCPNCKILACSFEELKQELKSAESASKESQDQIQNLQNTVELLESKLKIIECSREEYENENYDLHQTISFIKSKKKHLKSKLQDLEKALNSDETSLKQDLIRLTSELSSLNSQKSELAKENSNLNQRLQILTLKCEELEFNTSHSEKPGEVNGLVFELQTKLEKLRIKEKELQDFQCELNEERKVIQNAAEYIKNINDDLSKQKLEVDEGRGKNEQQKMKILELDKKQQDKAKMLEDKEKELNLYREKLVERENLIVLKERGVIDRAE